MPGFLSAYEGTERIDLGDGYWVDVKKCLSSAEYAPVELALGARQQVNVNGGRQFAQIDTRAARIELVVASIVAWNVDDEDGTVWPLTPEKVKRANVERLPHPVREVIWKRCDDLNGPEKPADRARFPDPDGSGDPDGDGGTAGAGGIPDGEGVLAAVGPDEGGAAGAPAA
jgi:hypothetical protein